MILCGHELGRNWYNQLKNEVNHRKRDLEELESLQATIKEGLARPSLKKTGEQLAGRFNEFITADIEAIQAEKKNLENFTNAIKSLPEQRQKDFSKYHYIEGKTIEEIAVLMAYAPQTIHEIRKLAIKGLKKYMDTQTAQ